MDIQVSFYPLYRMYLSYVFIYEITMKIKHVNITLCYFFFFFFFHYKSPLYRINVFPKFIKNRIGTKYIDNYIDKLEYIMYCVY